jgi:hypothetical protein
LSVFFFFFFSVTKKEKKTRRVMSVASKLSPALKKAAEASRSRILARVQAAIGADSLSAPTTDKLTLGEYENDRE